MFLIVGMGLYLGFAVLMCAYAEIVSNPLGPFGQ